MEISECFPETSWQLLASYIFKVQIVAADKQAGHYSQQLLERLVEFGSHLGIYQHDVVHLCILIHFCSEIMLT